MKPQCVTAHLDRAQIKEPLIRADRCCPSSASPCRCRQIFDPIRTFSPWWREIMFRDNVTNRNAISTSQRTRSPWCWYTVFYQGRSDQISVPVKLMVNWMREADSAANSTTCLSRMKHTVNTQRGADYSSIRHMCVLTDTCRGCAAQRVATRDEMVKTRRLSCVTTSVSFREPLDALKLKSQSGMCTSRLSVPSKCQECSSTAELKQSGQPWRRRFRADGYYGFPLYTCDGV